MSDSPLHVIVLDDRSRFALHVWRYLSRSVGFGIGDIPRNGKVRQGGEAVAMDRPWRLETPAGDAVVWWVSIRNTETVTWEEDLGKALAEATQPERRVFLIDVRGEPAGPIDFWRLAFEALEKRGIPLDPQDVWLVSSYGVGIVQPATPGGLDIPFFHIRPKSSETLQRLAERIWPTRDTKSRRQADPKVFHFLVSGAGFELKSRNDPPITRISPLGVPPTSDLLRQAYQDEIWQMEGAGGMPVIDPTPPLPLPLIAQAGDHWGPCLGAAWQGLDQLWDALLETVLGVEKGKQQLLVAPRMRKTAMLKAGMLKAEESARESFRSAFFGDDWGELTQTLDAAALPWDVWLTTNYTQFVDRAVALLRGRKTDGPESVPPWRILSIASEAEHLLRRLFFEQRGRSGERLKERFLFKLHGDLGHLSTMAVAGQDKELFSLTTQTVDHFYWLYDAAQAWMKELLKAEKGARVFWHVAGHGLQDQLLLDSLRQVVDSTADRGVRHSFLLIQPKPEAVFKALDADTRSWDWLLQPYRADQWMAMLRKYWRIEGQMWTPDDGDLPTAVRGFIR